MKKYLNYKLIFILPILLILVGCPKDDTNDVVIRPYNEVYAEDIAEIEVFLETHKMNVDADYNVTFEEITVSNPGTSIFEGLDTSVNQDDVSKPLKVKIVNKNDIAYKLYYIKLREGNGNGNADTDDDSPTKLDSIYTAFKGFKLDLTSFDAAPNPVWFQLEDLIPAWSEIYPNFKVGTYTPNSDGTFTFNDFGAGVMFVPSGLGYFNVTQGTIESYTPIIFNFKLMNLKYKDHDRDKILTKDEVGANFPTSFLDSDNDGIRNYQDIDDDNDGVPTNIELKNTSATLISSFSSSHYVYSSIPFCTSNSNGKPLHLDPACHDD